MPAKVKNAISPDFKKIMNQPFNVDDQNIFISGGTRGIGRAIALDLARSGANVVVNYVRNMDSAEELEKIVGEEGIAIRTLKADIASPKGVEKIADCMDELDGPLGAFIHCAATGVHRPFQQVTLRHFDFTYAVNIRAFLGVSQAILPKMGKGSSIIALSSIGAERAVDQYSLTGSSKGALESLVRHMAAELAPQDIRVNCISPGTMRTDAWKVLPNSEERLAHAAAQSPRNRLTSLEEVAHTARFLCSPASNGIIGQTIVVDNGCRIME